MAYKITIFLKNTQKNISFSFELMGVNSLRDEVNGCMPCFFILSKHNNPCPSSSSTPANYHSSLLLSTLKVSLFYMPQILQKKMTDILSHHNLG